MKFRKFVTIEKQLKRDLHKIEERKEKVDDLDEIPVREQQICRRDSSAGRVYASFAEKKSF